MAADLTPPFPWAVVESLSAEPLYSDTDILRLFVAVGPPPDAREKVEATAFQLSELGKSFAFDLWRQVQPSASATERQARRLAAALLEALTIAGQGEEEFTPETLPPLLGSGGLWAAAVNRGEPSGKAFTQNALRAMHLLRLDALRLAEVAAKRRDMSPPKVGRKPDRAMALLVEGLASLYFAVWDSVPAVSRDNTTNEPIGPLVRLMVDVAGKLRARGLVFGSTPESLAKHWERLSHDRKLRLTLSK